MHNARSIVRDFRAEGHALWERFTQKSARDQLWCYSGLLGFFDRRRPGPLTGDLWRAVGELAWLVAYDEAQHTQQVRLWLDPDLHDGAPEGWVQVRTTDEAIRLLDAFPVLALSLDDTREAHKLTHWLLEQTEPGSADRWPSEEISFHGNPTPVANRQLQAAIERHAEVRGRSPRQLRGAHITGRARERSSQLTSGGS